MKNNKKEMVEKIKNRKRNEWTRKLERGLVYLSSSELKFVDYRDRKGRIQKIGGKIIRIRRRTPFFSLYLNNKKMGYELNFNLQVPILSSRRRVKKGGS